MELTSLGMLSERIFTHFDGEWEDRGDYIVVRSPTNPNYFWGNLLIFDRAPRRGDFANWSSLFKKEFTNPAIYHATFAWQTPNDAIGDIAEFEKHGFELDTKLVLSATVVHPPSKFNGELVVKPIHDSEWQRVIDIQVECGGDNLPKHEWRLFYQSQCVRYRKMIAAGRGFWFGGYIDGTLVASLGIFHEGDLGRYQSVSTHPDYARRGICGTLVYRSAQYAFAEMNVKKLVMCADPNYHAAGIYQSVGFGPVQTEHGVYWWDKNRAL